jgi:hypothetical protein
MLSPVGYHRLSPPNQDALPLAANAFRESTMKYLPARCIGYFHRQYCERKEGYFALLIALKSIDFFANFCGTLVLEALRETARRRIHTFP